MKISKKKKNNWADALIDEIGPQKADVLYRTLWKNHVMDDVEATLEQDERVSGMDDDRYVALVEKVAGRYVDGKYDCNMSYWDNITNLIDEYLEEEDRVEMTELERIQKAFEEGDVDVSAEVMAELLMDDGNSSFKMFEELASDYINAEEESYRKGLDNACRVLTGYSLAHIADDVIEKMLQQSTEKESGEEKAE